jgi:kinesin family protein C2/C3
MQALGKRSKKASKAASGGTGGEGGGEDKMSHVPFRDSKLTYLLQDSLSGGSKVLMFVNVSPAAYNYSETLSSLLFASRCRAIELGKATKNEESGEALQMRRDMAKLKKAVADAKAEIDAKVEKLNAAEKREMVLSQQVASTAEDAKAMKGSAAARQQEHQDRLERMMDEKVLREEELASVRGEVRWSVDRSGSR